MAKLVAMHETSSTISLARATERGQSLRMSSQSIALDLREMASSPTFGVGTLLHLVTRTPTLTIDFLGGSVEHVEVDGTPHPFAYDGAVITVDEVPTDTEVGIKVTGTARYSRTGQGLHRFADPSDGRTYLYSHLEPSDARRIFPCFDQPDLKVRFDVELLVPEATDAPIVALSNQPEIAREQVPGGTLVAFAQTPPLSTYLTSFAVGAYVGKHATWRADNRTIEAGVWARASMAQYVDEEFLEITLQGLSYFDEAFGFPYPWGKYDSILVPEYNLGAMENPGLVTFNERYIFRDEATRAQHATRANTILHEMSHMWFGDLVTPRWWDDLWLKESFAEFMGADGSAYATDYTEAWTNFAGGRKNWAYAQDQLPTTHPIKATIPDVDAARQNFDGITYAKGAAVLKQLVHYVGRDNFYAAARDYFRTHAFSAATFDDLLAALKAHTELDLDSWAKRWLQTPGPDRLTPVLEVADGRIASLAIRTTPVLDGQPTRPHRLDVGLYRVREQRLERFALLDVLIDAEAGADVPIAQAIGLEAPDLVLLNDGDHTYATISFDERSLATIKEHLSRLDDELSRAVIWTALWNLTRDAQLPAADYVELALVHGARETNVTLATQIFANAQFAARRYTPMEQRAHVAARYADTLWDLVAAAPDGSDAKLLLTRAVIGALTAYPAPLGGATQDKAAARLRVLLADDLGTLGTQERWDALAALAARGQVTDSELEAEQAADNTLTGKANYLRASHSLPRAGVKAETYEQVTTPGAFANAEVDALLDAFNAPGHDALREPFIERFFAELEGLWAQHPIEIANRLVRGLFPHTPTALELADAALARPLPDALRRVLLECRDGLRRELVAQGALARA